MPEVPPVIRMVLPVIFIGVSLVRCGGTVSARSLDRRAARARAGEKVYPWIGCLCLVERPHVEFRLSGAVAPVGVGQPSRWLG
jgi:hypothetical protein